MCDAEDEVDELRDEVQALQKELASYQGSITITNEKRIEVPLDEVERMPHLYACFILFAGCVCIKRFVDYVETPTRTDQRVPWGIGKKGY